MPTKYVGLLAFTWLVVSSAAHAQSPPACLSVRASGFANARGHAILRLYRPGDNVTADPPISARSTIASGRAQFCVELPRGEYAAVVLHDANDNGRVDHNVFGIPSEPLGFSGGFRLGLFSGMPTFARLRFNYVPGMAAVGIVVQ